MKKIILFIALFVTITVNAQLTLLDEGKINFWHIYSFLRCQIFMFKNGHNAIPKVDSIDNYIKEIVIDNPDKIKYFDDFTQKIDYKKYDTVFDWDIKNNTTPDTGLYSSKNIVWDGNSCYKFLNTHEEGYIPKGDYYSAPFRYNYKVGMINTAHRFNFNKGWIHCKMKLPHNADNWEAFWLLGDTSIAKESPIVPEIDIIESMQNQLVFSMHLSYIGNKLRNSCNHIDYNSNQWFIMSMHWTDDFIDWYVNGVLVKRYGTHVTEWYNKARWFILNEAYVGDVDLLTGKDGMIVDYIIITDENLKFFNTK